MLEYTIIAIGVGLILWLRRRSRDERTADAIGLVGVALIGASIALFVGKNADENTRTVGINNILAQVESVTDSHQGTRACSRYVVAANLIAQLVTDTLPNELPPEPRNDKALCLAGLYGRASEPVGRMPIEVQWSYLRAEIMSFLNVIELAAAYSTSTFPVPHKKAQSFGPDMTGQQMLIRYLDGMLFEDDDSKILMRKWVDYENEQRTKPNQAIEEVWTVCRTVDCKPKS